MSDTMEDMSKRYEEEVLFDLSSLNAGLFPIPEYPPLVLEPGMWSTALDVILTTLRYLTPATLLSLFWGQQSFVFKLLKHVDSAFRAIAYTSEEHKREVLKWVSEAGSARIEHLDTIWRHGWIMCGVLDAALPGVCAGHPPTRLSLKHAQAIADHYLGVEPVFSRQELESSDSLSRQQEWKFAAYLTRIRQALDKLTPPVSMPASERTSPETATFTIDYIARGSGLLAAQINHKMRFKIYPTAQQCLEPGEITVLIKGPKDTYGMTLIPPILGKAQLIRQKLLGLQVKKNYTKDVLPITQGATYLRSFGKNEMSKTYFIPKVKYDIEIEFESSHDHVIIDYIMKIEGKYEISITSRGQNILGSPFQVTASQNDPSIFERESFCLEDGEEIDIVDVPTDKKVVLRIVDFVTEKMLLTEDGVLEKISEDEAQKLMNTDKETLRKYSGKFTAEELTQIKKSFESQQNKFKNVAHKIKTLCKICKVFNNFLVTSNVDSKAKLNYVRPKSPQDIPDIVNSTFNDSNKYPFVNETRSKYIIPESISVSIRNEINDNKESINLSDTETLLRQIMNNANENTGTGNPFVDNIFESTYTKDGVYVNSEYEADFSQNEDEPEAPIKIIVDEDNTTPTDNNPFAPEIPEFMERPKTPVLKIITGDVKNREDSLYVDPKIAETFNDDILGNEFINPFFMHQHLSSQDDKTPATDFLIGAPVSLPPIIRATTPEPTMESMILSNNKNSASQAINFDDESASVFSTPMHTCIKKKKDNLVSSTFHSLDSDLNENTDLYDDAVIALNPIGFSKNVSPRKELWDSAYVSIDDVASSPDSNNNDNTSPSNVGYAIVNEDLSKMGPAEKEIWQSCNDLKCSNLSQAEIPLKIQDKRLLFTPIIEESDRSSSVGLNTTPPKQSDIESVTVAFAEINDIYHKYYPFTEISSSNHTNDKNISRDTVNFKGNKDDVDSASETKSDVKRQTMILEGEISEIQPLVTESISASRTLRYPDSPEENSQDKQTNIVLEKKLYWDKKIKEIEAKAAEINAQQKRRKLSAKYLRNDSLTKRKGKHIVKTIMNKEIQKPIIINRPIEKITKCKLEEKEELNIESQSELKFIDDPKNGISDEKLVEKWKRYWDSKLETEKDMENICLQSPSPKNDTSNDHKKTVNSKPPINRLPPRQELPEEVFKAFETSPKRFFGTSRKQILNKIDVLTEIGGASKDTGLVSSRISLFHNISHTEDLPSTRKKSQSMHNISQRKNSDAALVNQQKSQPTTPEPITHQIKNVNTASHNEVKPDVSSSVKEKRAQFVNSKTFSKTLSEHNHEQSHRYDNHIKTQRPVMPSTSMNRFYPGKSILRKTSLSKSEMDIFSKQTNTVTTNDYLERYQSCDDLPKVNVKSFISLYETVSKISIESKPRKMSCGSLGSHKNLHSVSSLSETARSLPASSLPISREVSESPKTEEITTIPALTIPSENDLKQDSDSGIQIQNNNTDDDRYSYISLSDMEVEIIEYSSPEKSMESTPERETEQAHIQYKTRFKTAKDFFKSLEEIRDDNKTRKLNECEQLLYHKSTDESPEAVRPPRRIKKNIKSNSVPSSEIAKAWNQLQNNKNDNKLVKISEKFNVEDLYSDVVEGKLSRQGSLRGIPNKKAVLETFKSMDNLTDKNISAYESVITQLKDFTKESKFKDAQTYLTEYPYLPTTDPSKYHSRMDTKASGLISLKELLDIKNKENQKPRRNSVPDIRMNAKFTVDL